MEFTTDEMLGVENAANIDGQSEIKVRVELGLTRCWGS